MKNPYKVCLDTFGAEVQYRFAIEEMSELTKAICKYQRKIDSASAEEKEKLESDIIEEVADVLICCEQLRFMFGENKVDKVKKFKIDRALKRCEEKNTEFLISKK